MCCFREPERQGSVGEGGPGTLLSWSPPPAPCVLVKRPELGHYQGGAQGGAGAVPRAWPSVTLVCSVTPLVTAPESHPPFPAALGGCACTHACVSTRCFASACLPCAHAAGGGALLFAIGPSRCWSGEVARSRSCAVAGQSPGPADLCVTCSGRGRTRSVALSAKALGWQVLLLWLSSRTPGPRAVSAKPQARLVRWEEK